MKSSYQVALGSFEGPLDLLLQLIEKDRLSITEVSLASVADQYLTYMKRGEETPLEDLASFLSVAAKLILIKSRALLPVLQFTETEEEAIHDLQLQLELYSLFKGGAEVLGAKMAEAKAFIVREKYLGLVDLYYPPKDVTVETLEASMEEFLGGTEKEVILEEQTMRRIISLEKRIREVQDIIAERGTLAFREMISQGYEKEEVIVSFLALLELMKQNLVFVSQTEIFEEITIQKI
jgi:segregation and condensation protein A